MLPVYPFKNIDIQQNYFPTKLIFFMVAYHYMWKRNFTPQKEQMMKQRKGLYLAKTTISDTPLTLFQRNVKSYLFFNQKENKQQVSATRHSKYCFEKMEERSQTCLGKIIIPLPFNYNYHAKNSCIVLHSFIIVKETHLWNMKIFNALQMNTAGCLKPGLKY